MPINMVVDQLTSMRNKMIYHQIRGEYKRYVTARKDFAKHYMQNPEAGLKMPKFQGHFGIFSKYGLNIMKTMFFDLFRKKTPDEIKLKQFAQSLKDKEVSGWNG